MLFEIRPPLIFALGFAKLAERSVRCGVGGLGNVIARWGPVMFRLLLSFVELRISSVCRARMRRNACCGRYSLTCGKKVKIGPSS